ncbi:hypothetical protein MBM_03807 [Drepanopeziza brunnea f. sp. 'multigermtubi' MB_m1]|uniref:Uncharacterized protein n=1 Tax=Marssonina brunnea f. sp. multigermtubi (strain MB_m1) TaxID=1072389 RepID=K1WK07_MARBU|nr:uncharacterized protein MBM_03807 [Drepanopeziza brunnea f. sp. 'multigermtubi' MB_m1]EKD18035.1 hypothetical protein MBM_03807 [Drepanopeziza brunnea f. sp. 'multigermtubi' MB_m1]
MIFTNSIYAALLAASAVTAAPSPGPPRNPDDPMDVLLCEDPAYHKCQYVPIVFNKCSKISLPNLFEIVAHESQVNVPAELQDKISSLDTWGYSCTFYDDGNCSAIKGLSRSADYRGSCVELSLYPSINFLNDAISSFKCV